MEVAFRVISLGLCTIFQLLEGHYQSGERRHMFALQGRFGHLFLLFLNVSGRCGGSDLLVTLVDSMTPIRIKGLDKVPLRSEII